MFQYLTRFSSTIRKMQRRKIKMKSDVRVKNPKKRPVCSNVSSNTVAVKPSPSRFRRKKQFEGDTTSFYNGNFHSMPRDT